MRGKSCKTLILTCVSMGMLLAGGGCMLLPHPGHGGSNAEHVHVADAGSSAQPGATATAGQAEPNLVSPPAPSPASHHGVGDARSPWTWLAGAGLAAMMVLMLL